MGVMFGSGRAVVPATSRVEQGKQAHTCIEQVGPFAGTCNHMIYVPHADILYLFHDKLEPGLVVEVEGWFAYRVSYDMARVVAVEIHDFKYLFLPEHPEFARAWRQFRNPLYRLLQVQNRAGEFVLAKASDLAAACASVLSAHEHAPA